jgi:hypothetical protein
MGCHPCGRLARLRCRRRPPWPGAARIPLLASRRRPRWRPERRRRAEPSTGRCRGLNLDPTARGSGPGQTTDRKGGSRAEDGRQGRRVTPSADAIAIRRRGVGLHTAGRRRLRLSRLSHSSADRIHQVERHRAACVRRSVPVPTAVPGRWCRDRSVGPAAFAPSASGGHAQRVRAGAALTHRMSPAHRTRCGVNRSSGGSGGSRDSIRRSSRSDIHEPEAVRVTAGREIPCSSAPRARRRRSCHSRFHP